MTAIPVRQGHRPILIDGFCCSGGAAVGYYKAGWDVVGVDIEDQPSYPFAFHKGDALQFLAEYGHLASGIHQSPPCQHYTPLNAYNHKEYPDLIAPTREACVASGLPYIIENVEAAKTELRNPVLLCGKSFGLPMYRHRLFETSFGAASAVHLPHKELCTRNGYLPTPERPFMTITGGKHSEAWRAAAAAAMEMPWSKTIREVCEAIPPAYTQFLGRQMLDYLKEKAA